MSLIDSMMERFVLLEKSRVDDGDGGWVTSWVEGISFDAAATPDNTAQALIADKQSITSNYTITTKRSVSLKFHDVIRRVSDSAVFRITSDSDDKRSPKYGTLDMAQSTAERWMLT